MSNPIKIKDERSSSYTMLSNVFIDRHMPSANGEFVKIYIYLLHLLQKPDHDFSLSSAADVFSCTENDVLRALLFWERSGLVALDRDADEIAGIRVVMPGKDDSTEPAPAAYGTPSSLSNERRRQLMQDEAEVAEILMFAEEYLGRPLSSSDQNRLLYLYDELHFSVDLLDYLIEYCVLKEKRSMHYIEKVGLEWYNDGVKTVAQAKERTNRWHRDYYEILRAFGVTNRNPVSREIPFMEKWLNTCSFPMDLIREACARTVTQTGRASFEYADKILSSWHASGAHTLTDVRKLDDAHESTAGKQAVPGTGRKSGTRSGNQSEKPARNKFNNFTQRSYDYANLEQTLLNRQAKPQE